MISVLMNWLYMSIITYLTGSLCLFVFGIKAGVFHRIFTGILFVTCYAQIFSIFAPLSLWANVGLLGLSLLSLTLCRSSLVNPVRKSFFTDASLADNSQKKVAGKRRFFTRKTLTIFGAFVFVILFALCTAGPPRQYDTNYYHAQTIHWLEEYGAVKGAATLFYPLANNNAGHYFDAVFSMKFLTGRSLHTTGGFFGLLIFLHGLKLIMRDRRELLLGDISLRRYMPDGNHLGDEQSHDKNKMKQANLLTNPDDSLRKKALLMYTGTGIAEMVYAVIMTAYYTDPYTDILPNVLVFFVASEWMIAVVKKKADIRHKALLSILAVFAAICKLTVWPIALLMFVPLTQIIKKRQWKSLLCIFGVGLFTVLPTFATNAVISGYILYPVYFLDFLNVPWKLDKGILEWQVSSAVEFARLRTTDPFHPLNTGLSWIPFWISKQATVHQVLYVYILILFGIDIVSTVRSCLCKTFSDIEKNFVILRAICYITLVYWFFTMPELRFVWSFIFIILVAVPASTEGNGCVKGSIGIVFFLLCTALYDIRTIGYARTGLQNAPVIQGDYERREGVTKEIDGQVFVTEISGDPYVCGYYLFPYYENYTEDNGIIMGKSIRDGFYFGK